MPKTAIVGTNKTTYSFSRLSTFERCERSFYHKYIEFRPEPSGMPAIVGKIFHLAMELVINEGYTPDDAVDYAIYGEAGLPQGETVDNLVYMVKRTFYRVQQLNTDYADVLSELHLEVDIGDGRKLQGFLDILIDDPASDEVSITDFKTSWQPFSAEESKQLKLYAWMFKQMRGGFVADTFKGILIFPRRAEFADSEVIFTDEEMEEAYQWAVDTIDKIESKNQYNIDEWKMTTDRSICNYCPRTTLCSGGFKDGLPGDGIPKDDLEALAIGEYIRMEELAIKRMKDGLRKYATDNGPVSVQGGRWDFSQSEPSPKVPVSVVKQYAEEHDLDLEKVFKTDNTTLKKWIEEDSTGYLDSQAKWTNPRKSFKFVEEKKDTKEPDETKVKGEKSNE